MGALRSTCRSAVFGIDLEHCPQYLSLEKLIALGVGAVVSLVSRSRVSQTACVKVRCDARRAAIGKAIPLAVYDAAVRLSQLLGANRRYIAIGKMQWFSAIELGRCVTAMYSSLPFPSRAHCCSCLD